MRFIQEFGYTVKIGKDEAHQRWLIENDAALRAAAPKGTKYIGTFAVVLSSEKSAGPYKQLIELDSYGALDAAAAANKDPKSELGRLLREQLVELAACFPMATAGRRSGRRTGPWRRSHHIAGAAKRSGIHSDATR